MHHHPEGRGRAVHRGDGAVAARCHHDRAQSHQGQLHKFSDADYSWLILKNQSLFLFCARGREKHLIVLKSEIVIG